MDEMSVLATAARDGDRLALGRLIRISQADVYRTCARLGPVGGADDLTQETYIRLMKSLPSFRGESSFRTWLLAIARNVCADALRAQKRRSLLQRSPKFIASVITEQTADVSVGVRELIQSLDPSRREAFVLTQLIGLSYEEAAAVCDVPIGTIRSRVARARSHLIDLVGEVDADSVRQHI